METLKSATKNLLKRVLPPPVWNKLMLSRIRQGVKSYSPRWVAHVYGGVPLKVRLADPVGEGWYDKDWPELAEIRLLQTGRLRAGARIFDVGAHQGVVAMMLARIVGQQGSVVAVEANPHNARIAEMNRAENKFENLRIVHAAIGERPGTLVFNEDLNGQVDSSNSLGRIEVQARTIDSLVEECGAPDVLFIDVEGFEVNALRGASRCLTHSPDVFVEVHVGAGLEKMGFSVNDVLHYFPEDRFEVYVGRPEGDEKFHLLNRKGPQAITSNSAVQDLMKQRFHLVALAKRG